MAKVEVKELLDGGVHFGHLTRKWDPNMAPYIYMERNGIHIINLYKTAAKLDEACQALSKIAASGRKILFVATKKQAKDIVAEKAGKANMPYITERWPGGMLTNFVTIRKAVKKMSAIDRTKQDGTFEALSKREKLQRKFDCFVCPEFSSFGKSHCRLGFVQTIRSRRRPTKKADFLFGSFRRVLESSPVQSWILNFEFAGLIFSEFGICFEFSIVEIYPVDRFLPFECLFLLIWTFRIQLPCLLSLISWWIEHLEFELIGGAPPLTY